MFITIIDHEYWGVSLMTDNGEIVTEIDGELEQIFPLDDDYGLDYDAIKLKLEDEIESFTTEKLEEALRILRGYDADSYLVDKVKNVLSWKRRINRVKEDNSIEARVLRCKRGNEEVDVIITYGYDGKQGIDYWLDKGYDFISMIPISKDFQEILEALIMDYTIVYRAYGLKQEEMYGFCSNDGQEDISFQRID